VIHAVCGEDRLYGSKTFIGSFNQVKVSNYLFSCDECKTKWEQREASSLKEQMEALATTVTSLVKEFQTCKEENKKENKEEEKEEQEKKGWSNIKRVQKMKASLCIKSNGDEVDMKKIEEIATKNSIQVTKATVKENGDVYLDLPSKENREKFAPLLNNEGFAEDNIVELKSKSPAISILDVKEYESKEEFIEKIKQQNEKVKQLIDGGSEFKIVYTRPPNKEAQNSIYYQVVARVSEDVRKAIKENRDKLFVGVSSYRVVDRFYIKRCNKCQQYGHYEKDCENAECCGYCSGPHLSLNCQEVDKNAHEQHKCVNCEKSKKDPTKHSALWYKCPTYLEMQKKLKKTIPYYQKN
jgi:PHD/YefM family antitoxin component YafN of YafNO toxin-antitoxin module